MDFRFKYRKPASEAEVRAREDREQHEMGLRARQLAIALSIPATLLSGPLTGWALGYWLDQWMHTAFWLPTFIILGLIASLKLVVDQLNRVEQSRK